MDKPDPTISMKTLAVSTAMAGALLSGCAASPAPRADISATQAQAALAEGRVDRGLRLAEQAVQADPRNAAYRAMLGKAYLDAGRFASAETSFNDAMALGDNSPRTALSLALSLNAQARYGEAAALLNDWEGQIATADLGLALALSGQPERGIHLMGNAIRGGENTVKMRQNLAYAYAVAGRWREARLMAAQDVPADQVGARMAQWAEMASPDAYQLRIARLLGVPAGVRDMGQPAALALNNTPGLEQLAAEASGYAVAAAPRAQGELPAAGVAPAPVAPALPERRVAIPATASELPAVGRPAMDVAAGDAAAASQPTDFATAFATAAPSGGSLAQVTQDAIRFVNQPVVQSTPTRYGATPEQPAAEVPTLAQREAASAGARQVAARAMPLQSASEDAAVAALSSADGSHLVQLGSFSSEQGARRAWGIYVSRYPELASHDMVITEAVVRGKRYFRVSAAGFDRTASRAMCNAIDARGGEGCISWAANAPLPGALPSRREDSVRLARRN
ncbi:SPOR domain-containing protein [Alteraurantiacibacter buctensis]|nr:SPOR domain-containing protein [Alteraurantiacibacter buctensis]